MLEEKLQAFVEAKLEGIEEVLRSSIEVQCELLGDIKTVQDLMHTAKDKPEGSISRRRAYWDRVQNDKNSQ